MKSSCLSHPSNEPLLIIRKWQLQFCDGNHCAAALMSFFEYWHNWKLNTDFKHKKLNDIAEQHGDERSHNENILQFHSLQEITDGILGLCARNTVINSLKYLESKNALSIHTNPNPRYGFDKTKYYQFHPDICAEWLGAYNAQTSNRPSTFKNKPRSSEIKLSTFKNKPSSFKKGRSITEINNKDINQSNNSDSFNFKKTTFTLDNDKQANIQPIIDALIDKGMPQKCLNYPDSIAQVQHLQDTGATPAHFEEAYDIAAYATQGRGFGMRYLNKVVKDLLAQPSWQKSFSNCKNMKNLAVDKNPERTYENDLTQGRHWIDEGA